MAQRGSYERNWKIFWTEWRWKINILKFVGYSQSSVWRNIYYCVCLVTQLCPTLCNPMECSTPGLPVHHQLPEYTQTHVHWVGDETNHLILCRPLLHLPSVFPSIRVFSNESALCIRWPKHWSYSFNINPSNEHPGLISLRMDWLDLLTFQGTLRSLLQHDSSKASILQCSAFFTVPTLKTIRDYWKDHSLD